MHSKAVTVDQYITELPTYRIASLTRLRTICQETLVEQGFEERMSYGMIGYVVPLSRYSDGYHCDTNLPLPFVNLASQKNFVTLYHMGIYADPGIRERFTMEYPAHAKRKLNMGKSCLRFKKLDDIPYELIRALLTKMSVDEWIKIYESVIKKK